MSFAWDDPTTGHQKVVVHIKWREKQGAYFLDAGAYDHEQEVLLSSLLILVESVEEIKEDYKVLYTLITLKFESISDHDNDLEV